MSVPAFEIEVTPRDAEIAKRERAIHPSATNHLRLRASPAYAQIAPTRVTPHVALRDPIRQAAEEARAKVLASEASRVAQEVREAVLRAPEIVGDDSPRNRELIERLDRYFTGAQWP